MSEQLDLVYDYMIKHGKKLKKVYTCNICQNQDQELFTQNTSVCSKCWNGYVKMSKREKKDIQLNMRKNMKRDYEGTWFEYSERLGKSRDYLSVYKSTRHHLDTPLKAYNEVLKRMDIETEVCTELDELLSYIASQRRLQALSNHLVLREILSVDKSIRRIRQSLSIGRINLLEEDTLNLYRKLIKEIESWV